MPQIIPAVVSAIAYVGTATSAVLAGTATFAQIATVAAVGIGSGIGASAAASALSPKIASQGANVQWEANPDAPLRFAFGRVGVKGSIIDAAVYGPDNMYVSFACSVGSAGPIKRFVSFRADDYYMTFDGAGAAVNEPYRGEMWLSTRLGTQPDTALSLPSGLKNGASFPGWNSGRKLSGTAAYLVTLGENSKRSAYDSKVPTFIATIEGLFCYDPRLDSTYPGGSGECRLNDPLTWVYTENPILFALRWALGLWEGPNGKGVPGLDYQVGGIGVHIDKIVMSSVVEAANIADANGWRSAAWPSTDDDKSEVLDGFLKAAGANYAEIAGRIAFIHRAAPRSIVFTVTGRDTAGPVELDTTSSKLNRINTIRPRYWAEDQDWQMTALPEVTSSAWQIEDGQGEAVKRTRGVDFTFVPDPKQTRELATLQVAHTREGIRGRVPLRPYMDPEPGNCFTFDEPDFALSGLKCFVLSVEDDTESDTVVVTFESETDGKYPYAYGQTGNPPPPQQLSPIDPFFVSPPGAGDWTVTPRPPAPGGGQLPGFDITGIVSNSTATAIIVEYGLSATGPWRQAYQGPPTVTNIPLDGLQPGVQYWVAIQYQRDQNYSEREIFGPYTAPELIATDVSPFSPISIAVTEITDRLVTVEAISAANASAVADLEAIYGDTASAAASAAAAAQAKADAILAAADAIQAKTDSVAAAGASASSASQAGGFKNDAETASAAATQQKLDAIAAKDESVAKAAASATSAANAAASETAAGLSATASQTARTGAETARSQAETYRNETATARDTAIGSAATATTQAGLATTAKDAAAGSASAAAGSASTASTKAGEAGTSAAAASASQVSASTSASAATSAAVAIIPDTISAALWAATASVGAPDNRASLAASQVLNGAYRSGVGSTGAAGPKQYVRWENGRVYELTFIVSANGGSAANARVAVARRDAAFAALTTTFGASTMVAAGSEVTVTRRFGMGITPPGGTNVAQSSAEWVAFGVQGNINAGLNGAEPGADQLFKAFKIRDVTALVAAETSASASATSAANASASKTAAGQSATAASGSATTATTKAGEASTFASQASTSAGNAAGSASTASTASGVAVSARDQANTARDQAQASAASAVTQAANASASASSASISANLAAQAGIGSLNKNPTYSDWPTGQSLPNNIGGFGSVTTAKAAGKVSANAIQLEVASGVSNAGVEVAWTQTNWNGRLPVVFGQNNYWVIDYKIEVGTPGLQSSALRFFLTNGATGADASATIVKRLSEIHTSTGDDQIVEGSHFFSCNPTVNLSNYSARLAFFARTDPLSNYGRYFVHKLAARPATPTEIASGVALPAVQAQLSITASTAADLATRMATARFEVIAAAGSDPAQLLIRADSSGSLAALVAGSIRMSNVVGGVITEVMRLEGGRALFASPISIIQGGRRTTLGPGFGSGSALHLWSGPSTVAFGSETIDNGILGISATDGFFGGRNASGPFDSTVQAAAINLPKNTWTTVAQVTDKYIYDQAYILAALSYEIYVTGAAGGTDDYSYNLRLRMTNTDGSSPQDVPLSGLFGTGFPNTWVDLRAFSFREATVTTTKGRKNLYFQINPVGANITTAQARNRRLKGAWTQPIT